MGEYFPHSFSFFPFKCGRAADNGFVTAHAPADLELHLAAVGTRPPGRYQQRGKFLFRLLGLRARLISLFIPRHSQFRSRNQGGPAMTLTPANETGHGEKRQSGHTLPGNEVCLSQHVKCASNLLLRTRSYSLTIRALCTLDKVNIMPRGGQCQVKL